jgi:ribosomal small subunit protein bTHX
MGRGDKKSRKGKIFKGSYGVVRPRKTAVEIIIPVKKKIAVKEEVEEKTAVVKKKTAAKKKSTAKKQ